MSITLNVSVCRVCLHENDGQSLANNFNLQQKFTYATQLKINSCDGISDIICSKCVVLLEIAYKFRLLALQSENHLQSFAKKMQTELRSLMGQAAGQNASVLTDLEMKRAISESFQPTTLNNANYDEPDHGIVYEEIPETDVHKGEFMEVLLESSIAECSENSNDDEDVKDIFEECSSNSETIATKETKCATKRIFPENDLMGKNTKNDSDRPYQCLACEKTFRKKGTLKQHTYVHTGQRPYECKLCPKSFTQSKTLSAHMRIHAGVKPFTCEHCNVKFRTKDNLNAHQSKMHSFKCSVCGKILKSKVSLSCHMDRVHKGNSD